MATTTLESNRRAAGWGGLIALLLVTGLTLSIADQSSALTRSTIHLALVEYALALWLMIALGPEGWRTASPRGRLARWLWTWACLTFLMHVACAFHFTHHWSHAHAVEQTRRESGFGEGVYANYLFMAAWIADVAWWWGAAEAYAGRPRWIDRLLHGGMLFIAFNATVVFERGLVRAAGVALAVMLAARWFRRPAREDRSDSAASHPPRPSP